MRRSPASLSGPFRTTGPTGARHWRPEGPSSSTFAVVSSPGRVALQIIESRQVKSGGELFGIILEHGLVGADGLFAFTQLVVGERQVQCASPEARIDLQGFLERRFGCIQVFLMLIDQPRSK